MARALRGCSAVVGGVVVLWLLAGCGNKTEVCDETKTAFERLAAEVRAAPATDAATWEQVVSRFSVRLHALAGKSDDTNLKKVLDEASQAARSAANGAGDGDVAPLQRFLTEQPSRIGAACS
jgi:hypothetical protein